MITITENKRLFLTPKPGQKHPELEIPLQFGYSCPICEQVIFGAFEAPETHQGALLNPYAQPRPTKAQVLLSNYPLEYDSDPVELITGVRGRIFREEGHTVIGYDPFYGSGGGKIRCKLARAWFAYPPIRLALGVMKAACNDMHTYVVSDLKNSFEEKAAANPAMCLKFLELLEQQQHPQVFFRVNDVCGNAGPLFLLSREGLTGSRLEAILKEVLANS